MARVSSDCARKNRQRAEVNIIKSVQGDKIMEELGKNKSFCQTWRWLFSSRKELGLRYRADNFASKLARPSITVFRWSRYSAVHSRALSTNFLSFQLSDIESYESLGTEELRRHANMPNINSNPEEIYDQNSSTSSIMYLSKVLWLLFASTSCMRISENHFLHAQAQRERGAEETISLKWVSLETGQVRAISSHSSFSLFALLTNHKNKNYCLNHQLNLIGFADSATE